MILLFIYFLFLFVLFLKRKSLALVLVVIQVISLVGTFFIGRSVELSTLEDLSRIFITILLLSLIILPWQNYYGLREILPINRFRLKITTNILIGINIFVFIVFLTATIIIMTQVTNINEFKYAEGVSTEFYYSKLPIPVVFFNISILLYYFSYFMLPLHFYYLHKNRYWLSLLCFVLSLNVILYGLTFFSRAVVVQYLLLYGALLYLLYGTLKKNVQKSIKLSIIILGSISIIYFIDISQRRFEEDHLQAKLYSNTIPADAVIKDPLLFSYLDYTSQGFINGFEVLELYEGKGFGGALTLQSVTSFFQSPMDNYVATEYRQQLWPRHYSYSFNGFTAYAVYDYGIFGSILFCFIYFFIVRKFRPISGKINLKNLFLLTLLIQIPLMSIFYNQLIGILLAFIVLIPLWLYMKKE